MYELIAGAPLLDVYSLNDYRAKLAALHTMDLQVRTALSRTRCSARHCSWVLC